MKMPALFVGHGSPMNAVEDNAFRRGWAAAADAIPKPKAVLCVSAHWETRGVGLTAAERPETIHDFSGFPDELYAVRYPVPGDPALARATAGLVESARVVLDERRGLDHGAWSVLSAMYPEADVPVVQLSLDTGRPGAFHYALGRELAPLRDRGVLVLGSGNLVHNLGRIDFRRSDGYDWAVRFDAALKERIRAGDHQALVRYEELGPDAHLAVPTPEHFLPVLYVLALQEAGERATFFNEATAMGSVAMTSVAVGA
jgi:4,5-DOPA dioxygenase extradiol